MVEIKKYKNKLTGVIAEYDPIMGMYYVEGLTYKNGEQIPFNEYELKNVTWEPLETNLVKYFAGVDPYTPFLDLFKTNIVVFEKKEISRTLKKSKYFFINWYRKLFNKQQYNIEYSYKYTIPYEK